MDSNISVYILEIMNEIWVHMQKRVLNLKIEDNNQSKIAPLRVSLPDICVITVQKHLHIFCVTVITR